MIFNEQNISLEQFGFKENLIVKNTTNKNSYLKIDRNNQIVFLKSKFMPDKIAYQFLANNIAKFVDKVRIRKENIPYSFDEKFIILYGKVYKLIYKGVGKGFKFENKTLYLKGKDKSTALNNFIRKESSSIANRAREIFNTLNIECDVKIKKLKAVWGNCSKEKKIISLSQKLIFFKPKIIDYVIYHEIAHLTYVHHQKPFWDYVKTLCPDYKSLKNQLVSW